MNIEEEKEASRIRMENKRAQECAERLIDSQPRGTTLQEYMVVGLERWPGMSTDQHAAIVKAIRNRLEGEDPMSKAQVVELKIWLRTHLKEKFEANPTANPKAPATWTLAQEAGVARVTYDTFRSQYFYPIRDEVREELGIPKPVPKKGQKGFKTLARQKSDEKKAKDRREEAERKAKEFQATANKAGEGLVGELAKGAIERAAEGGDLLSKFEGSTEEHEKAHQELAEKVNGKPKREKRPHPLPLGNTLSIAELDAIEKGKKGSSEPPTYPEVTPPQAPSEPQVSPKWASSDPQETLDEPSPGSERDRQEAAEDVAPGSFPFQQSSEVHEKAHQELQEAHEKARMAFERDDAEESDLLALTRHKMEGWDDRLTLNLAGDGLGTMAFRVTSEGRVVFRLNAPDGKAFACLLEFFNDITSRMSWGKIIEGE